MQAYKKIAKDVVKKMKAKGLVEMCQDMSKEELKLVVNSLE